MISCMVDGFDPWEQVETLLRRIREDMIGRCEVILVASLLLDTPPEVCRSCGEEWFGNSFRMLRNDDYSIFRARLRAQELARGDTILYLSPSVVPAKGTLAGLAAALEADPSLSVCSAPLAFLFPGGDTPRLLAHGFAVGKDRRLTPILQGERLEAPVVRAGCRNVVPQPYCCCSRGPLYTVSDNGGSFWQGHLAACSRIAGGALSVGGAVAFLHDSAFPVYMEAVRHTRVARPLLNAGMESMPFSVSLTAYGRYRVGKPVADLPQGAQTEEQVFWGLLSSQRPEYIAAASSARPARPLGELARATLMEIAGIRWEEARDCAGEYLAPALPGWQSFSQWLAEWEPRAEALYARQEPSFRRSLKESRNLAVGLENMVGIVARGLWGRA